MHSKVLFLPVLILIILFNNTPVAAQSEAGDEGPIYIIQEGDTFWSIAKRFNVTVEELLAANPDIDPGLLAVGQQIKIPGLEGVNGILHSETVGFGETFRSLSRRTQVPDATFRKLNRLVSPAELYLGTNLIIPQPDTQAGLSTRSSLKAGETLLELAVKQNSDPWTLVDANNIKATWAALPGDILYSPTGTPDETATGLPSIFSSVEVGSLPLTQGRTARVRLQVEAGAQVSGTLVDHDLQFFQEEDSSFIALQGIHAMLEPGIYPLRLTAALPDGS
ncbi:MAG: LysM peptidoglycan-binding domain-containing protein, partial [Anaerolineales bacterium]|nr:LysM peptidoglycan-binding domain-containing protein [Anaerolineales bacterium]